MKIAVCFKTLADYPMLTERDWRVDEQHKVDLDWVRQVYNCYDESALELALQLAQDGPDAAACETTALTIDDSRADLFLRHLYAVQYDWAVRIDCGEEIDLRFNPLAVSLLIASYVQEIGGQQLVLIGSEGGMGDNRQTGFLVAERLGWPCIRDVIDVVPDESRGCLCVTSRREGAVLTQTVGLPLVLVIGNVLRSPYLRVPTLKEKLAAKKKQVLVLSPTDLAIAPDNLTGNDRTLVGLFRQRQDRQCVMLEGENAREKAKTLYHQYLAERLNG